MTRLSLQARLVLVALVTIAGTLAAAHWTIRRLLTENTVTMLNTKLDAQVEAFAATGATAPEHAALLIEFRNPDSLYGWRVRRRAHEAGGGVAFGAVAPLPGDQQAHDGITTGVARGANGRLLHVRSRTRNGVLVEVAGPERIVTESLSAMTRGTLIAVSALALALVLAAWLQLRAALGPVRAISAEIARVRTGASSTVSEQQPAELLSLAAEMNALIAQNAAGLANARRHVANLAHGLKTPLATLALRQAREGASAETRAIVAELDRRIEHHLARARSAAPGSGGRMRADVAVVAPALVRAMEQIHRRSGLAIQLVIPAAVAASVERQDLDEVLGNLLDNACRFARTTVRLTCRDVAREVLIAIEDDGPGIASDDIAAALAAGSRLDESGRGYGFGLAISQELAELYGGSLRLDRSADLGGLAATLSLPRAT